MKKLILINFLFVILSAVLLVSCSKDNVFNTRVFQAEALKNGETWGAEQAPFFLRGENDEFIHLRFYATGANMTDEQIDISPIPFQEGTYSLERLEVNNSEFIAATHSIIVGGDLVSNTHYLDPRTSTSFVTIDEISEDRKEIKGTFNLTFILDEPAVGSPISSSPRTIAFLEGTYSAQEGW